MVALYTIRYTRVKPHSAAPTKPVGSFADPDFPAPKHSVWEKRRHRWVDAFGEMSVEHSN